MAGALKDTAEGLKPRNHGDVRLRLHGGCRQKSLFLALAWMSWGLPAHTQRLNSLNEMSPSLSRSAALNALSTISSIASWDIASIICSKIPIEAVSTV